MQQALLSAGLPPPGIAPGQYSGRVKSYNPKQGYGFLECAEARAHYGRDVFIHKAQMGELLGRFVGPGTRLEPTALRMRVNFSVEVNKAGMPQAREVVRVDNQPQDVAALLVDAALPMLQPVVDGGAFPSPGSSPPPAYAAPLACTMVAPLPPPPMEPPTGSPTEPEVEASCGEDLAVKAGMRGYKGRGGTIRILHGAEVGLQEDLAVLAQSQSGGLVVARPADHLLGGVRQHRLQPMNFARGWRDSRGPRRPGRGAGYGSGMASGAGQPMEGRRRGGYQQDEYFQQRHQMPAQQQHQLYAQADQQQAYLPQQAQQAYAVQPYGPAGMQVYGLQSPQAMQAPGPPAAYASPYQQQVPPRQPPGPPLQYPPSFVSQPFQPPVHPPYQPDHGPVAYSPQFLPYQQPFSRQYVQQVTPDQDDEEYEGLEAYGTPQPPLSLPSTDSGSQEHLPGGCSLTGVEPGASLVPDAATPGSVSDDENGLRGLGVRAPNMSLLHGGCPGGGLAPAGVALAAPAAFHLGGGCCPGGLAASGLATGGSPVVSGAPAFGGWRAADLDRAMGHSL